MELMETVIFFTCSYSLKTNNITISCNYISFFFIIHTDKELKTNYSFGIEYDRDYLNSINDILGNTAEKVNGTADPFVSGFISLLLVKNIYIYIFIVMNFLMGTSYVVSGLHQ